MNRNSTRAALMYLATARPVSTVAVWAAVSLLGLVSLSQLDVELMPTIPAREVSVRVDLPGLPADEIERMVTVPVEDALAPISGVEEIRSRSRLGRSEVVARFSWSASALRAISEVRERVDAVSAVLPHGSSRPLILSYSPSRRPLMMLSLTSGETGTQRLPSRVARQIVIPALRRTPGVGAVEAVGAVEQRVFIEADPARMRALSLTIREVAEAVGMAVQTVPLGSFEIGSVEHPVRLGAAVDSVESLRALPIARGDALIRLGEVAHIELRDDDALEFFLEGTKPAIGIVVYHDPVVPAPRAARAIHRTVRSLNRELGPPLTLTVVHDHSLPVSEALHSVVIALVLGIGAATLVIGFLFRNHRTIMVIVSSIPASVLLSAIPMRFLGMTLNSMSLTGIAIGIGLIVDSAIVVTTELTRAPVREAASVAQITSNLAPALFGSATTTVLVFIPILAIPGLVGILFSQLALSVVFLVAGSLLNALTLTPALWLLISTGNPARPPSLRCVEDRLRPALHRWLASPRTSVAWYLCAVVAAVALFVTIPREVFASRPYRLFAIDLVLPTGTSLAATRLAAETMSEAILLAEPDAVVVAEGGWDERRTTSPAPHHETPNRATITVQLPAAVPEGDARVARLAETGTTLRSARVSVRPIRAPIEEMLGGTGGRLRALVRGGTGDEALVRAHQAVAALAELDPPVTAIVARAERESVLSLDLDGAALAHARLSTRAVTGWLSHQIAGMEAGTVTISSIEYPVTVRAPRAALERPEAITRLSIAAGTEYVPLETVVSARHEWVPTELVRHNRSSVVPMEVVLPDGFRRDRTVRTTLAAHHATVPSDTRTTAAHAELQNILLLVMGITALMLAAQFGSMRMAVLLLMMLPLSFAGSVLALVIIGGSINVGSVLGMLVLMGTAMNNVILLLDAYGDRSSAEIINGTVNRILPLSATVLTTTATLVPIAANPAAGDTRQSAVVVAAGLVVGVVAVVRIFPVWCRTRSPR
ncbi:MAG: efflux RND transporter permease subunit [Spirochaetaceae bacterium]|nr:MAG: efflux RND transporter permease subunit [Spirochaetaceae bacterium]